jgi:hypothetical protein
VGTCKSEHDERHTGRQEIDGWALAYNTASWLVSTFQLSGTPDLYIYKPNNIITSILPRQEERREAEESERGEWRGSGEKRSRSGSEGGAKEARTQKRCEDTHRQESTSEREYEVDA